MRVYDETCLALCEGQYLDISFERRDDVTVDAYLEMIGKKTAALVGASVQAGAILATDDDTVVEAYRRFGYDLGMAFQMADDVKGTFWSSDRIGQAGGGRRAQAQEDPAAGLGARARVRCAIASRLIEIYARCVARPTGAGPREAGDGPMQTPRLPRCSRSSSAAARASTPSPRRALPRPGAAHLETLPCPPDGKRELAILVRAVIAA